MTHVIIPCLHVLLYSINHARLKESLTCIHLSLSRLVLLGFPPLVYSTEPAKKKRTIRQYYCFVRLSQYHYYIVIPFSLLFTVLSALLLTWSLYSLKHSLLVGSFVQSILRRLVCSLFFIFKSAIILNRNSFTNLDVNFPQLYLSS